MNFREFEFLSNFISSVSSYLLLFKWCSHTLLALLHNHNLFFLFYYLLVCSTQHTNMLLFLPPYKKCVLLLIPHPYPTTSPVLLVSNSSEEFLCSLCQVGFFVFSSKLKLIQLLAPTTQPIARGKVSNECLLLNPLKTPQSFS